VTLCLHVLTLTRLARCLRVLLLTSPEPLTTPFVAKSRQLPRQVCKPVSIGSDILYLSCLLSPNMPVLTRLMSPPLATPSRSDMRTLSNNTSYTPTVVSGGSQQKLNVVTRVAIEGKVKRGQKGASIRMYLKVLSGRCCIAATFTHCVDLSSTGSCYSWVLCPPFPGFVPCSIFEGRVSDSSHPEENIRVLKSQVHPLDHNSAPYNFSSSLSPMLHSAARALNLPARIPQTFDSALKQPRSNHTHPLSIRSSRSEHNDLVPPVDVHYTGSIQISEYNVAFVLPKEFLPRSESDESYMRTPSKDISPRSRSDDEAAMRTPLVKSRLSISDRNQAQFMAAIDLWVPLLSTPPRSPFLVRLIVPWGEKFSNIDNSSPSRRPAACRTTLNFEYFLPTPHLPHLLRCLPWKRTAIPGT